MIASADMPRSCANTCWVCSPRFGARLNSQGITRERTAWIRDRTANLRMLDRAPIVALPVMRDVVILFGGVNQPPRDVVRLRAMEAFFAIAGGDQTRDGVTYDVARPVFRHAK